MNTRKNLVLLAILAFLSVTTIAQYSSYGYDEPTDTSRFNGDDFIKPNTLFKSLAGVTLVGKELYICDLGEQNVKAMSATSGSNQRIVVPTNLPGGLMGDCDAIAVSPDGKTLALASLGTGNITIVDIATGSATRVKTGNDTLCTFCGPTPVLLSGLFGVNSVAFSPSGKIYTAAFIGFNAFRLVDASGVNDPVNYLIFSSFGAPDFTTFFNNFILLNENQILAPSPNTGKVFKITLNHFAKMATLTSVEFSGLTYPVSVAASSDGTYYVADRIGNVYVKTPSGTVSVLATLESELDSLYLDDNKLYVTGNNNDVWRINLNGASSSVQRLLNSDVANPSGLAHDGTYLYAANGWDLRVFDNAGKLVRVIPTSDRPSGALVPLSSVSSVSLNGKRLMVLSSNTGNLAILDTANNLQLIRILPTGLSGITSALELPNGNVLVTFPASNLVFLTNSNGTVLGPIISGVTRPVGLARSKDRVFITGLGGYAPQIFGNPALPCTGTLSSIKLSSLLSFVPGPPLGASVMKNNLCYPEGVTVSGGGVNIAVVETGRKRVAMFDEEGIELFTVVENLSINTNIKQQQHFTGIASKGYDFYIAGNDVKPRIDVAIRKLISGCNPDEFRSIDGTCNNLKNPSYGAAQTFYRRGPEGAEYADGISQMVERGNPRTISNTFFAGPSNILNDYDVNMFEVFFGQFINHDLESNVDKSDPNDPFANLFKFAPLDPTDRLWRPTLDSLRVTNSSGAIVNGIFEVYNNQTAYLDLSTIYGTDLDMSIRLRTLSGGRLLTSDYTYTPAFPPGSSPVTYTNLPPKRSLTGLKALPAVLGMSDEQIFTSGDHRVHENIALSMMHTIWIREHNRIADNLSRNHPLWGDERIYQEARKRTIAIYQHIVFDEYLPTVIRQDMGSYSGYRSNQDPGTLSVFASLAFRYGHSTLSPYTTLDKCLAPIQIAQGPPIPPSPIPPLDTKLPFLGQIGGFIPPVQMIDFTFGFGNLVRSLLLSKAAKTDLVYSDDVRNIDLSFGGINTGGAGIDLGAFDIFRPRNNGIPNYYVLRKNYLGKSRSVNDIYKRCSSDETTPIDDISCFLLITSNVSLANDLQNFYKKVNNIDPMVGLLAEDREPGMLLPTTLANIIATEYNVKRVGDRFWYENGAFDLSTIQRIKRTSFSDVIKRTISGVDAIPDDIFHVPADFDNNLKDSTCGQVLPTCDFVTLFPPACQVPPTLPACSGSLVPPACNYICSNPPSPSDNPSCKPRCAPPSLLPPNCYFVSS